MPDIVQPQNRRFQAFFKVFELKTIFLRVEITQKRDFWEFFVSSSHVPTIPGLKTVFLDKYKP